MRRAGWSLADGDDLPFSSLKNDRFPGKIYLWVYSKMTAYGKKEQEQSTNQQK
jgi:hypothetical protein